MRKQRSRKRLGGLLVGVLTLCITTVLLLSSCAFLEKVWDSAKKEMGKEEPAQACEHQYSLLGYVGEYCCTEGGVQRLVCDLCGETSERKIEPRSHTAVSLEVPATCTKEGNTGGEQCETCHQILVTGTPLSPKGHSYTAGICTSCGLFDGASEESDFLEPYSRAYGYEALGKQENGEALQRMYREIDEAVVAFHTDPAKTVREDCLCCIRYKDLGLTQNEALAVWKTYRDDRPLYYWIANRVQYTSVDLYVVVEAEYQSGEARMEQNGEIYTALAEYRLAMQESERQSGVAYTAYNKTVYLHNSVIQAADYARNSKGEPELAAWAHTVVGVFNGRGAVCEGFAKAYQLLLNFEGVEAIYVTGESEGTAHAWNVVKLNGVWYGVDITWDDSNEEDSPYRFFLLSEKAFSKNHKKGLPTDEGVDFLYEIPTLGDYNYEPTKLYKSGLLVGTYTSPNAALNAINDPNGTYTIKLLEAESLAEHMPEAFHIYGCKTLPTAKSLTLEGTHTVTGNRYVATVLKIDTDLTVSYSLTLKSLFLEADTGQVTLWKVGTTHISYGSNQTYYSDILESVTVRRR